MNGNGEPLEASYGILQFGAGNRLDDSLTTYQLANAPESAVLPLAKTGVARKVTAFSKLVACFQKLETLHSLVHQ